MLVEEHVIALSCLSRPRVPSVAQTHSVRELKQPRRRRQREWQKAMGLDWQNNNFARASRFLFISYPSLHDYKVKVLHFTFCRGREHKTTTLEFNSKNVASI